MPFNEEVDHLVSEYLNSCKDITSIKAEKSNLVPIARETEFKINTLRGRPLFFQYVGSGRGQGPYVELSDGSVKIDLINGIGVQVLGHAHPEILQATVKASLSDVVMQGHLQPNKEYVGISEKLVELGKRNSSLAHCWLSQSGSMANENGLKICRQKTNGARMVIAMEKAFAGRTTMMAEVTDNENYRVGLPRYEEVLRVPFYNPKDQDSTEKAVKIFKQHVENHRGNICSFMFEPMQGEGGYTVAPREYFLPMLEICKEEGIPVFLDEVQTFCRTGNFFAYETLNIGEYVDVVSVAKTLQNGATLYTKDFNPKPGLISGTFAGSTQALAAGLKVLEVLDSGYMGKEGKISQIHKNFVQMLKNLESSTCQGLISDAGGLGLMVAFTPFDGSKEKMITLVKDLFDRGVMSFGCGSGPFRVRFLLPAILDNNHIEEIRKVLEASLLELK